MATRLFNKNGLTLQQQAFVDAYTSDPAFNGTNAARAAGYKGDTKALGVTAVRLLGYPRIKAAIQEMVAKSAAKAELTIEKLDRRIAQLAFVDMRKFYDEAGNLKPIHELDEDTAAALAAIEVVSRLSGRGRRKRKVSDTTKIRVHDVNQALLLAGRRLGAFRDKFDVTATVNWGDLIREIHEHRAANARIVEGKRTEADSDE